MSQMHYRFDKAVSVRWKGSPLTSQGSDASVHAGDNEGKLDCLQRRSPSGGGFNIYLARGWFRPLLGCTARGLVTL